MILPPWVSEYKKISFEDYDCWQLVCKIYREQFAIVLPSYCENYNGAGDTENIKNLCESESKSKWLKVPVPEVGDVVLMRIHDIPCHIGVCVDSRKHLMIHVMRKIDVTIEDYSLPRWKNRKPGFFKYVR